jgi:hypothetical protein
MKALNFDCCHIKCVVAYIMWMVFHSEYLIKSFYFIPSNFSLKITLKKYASLIIRK